jgi:hypothetical protein
MDNDFSYFFNPPDKPAWKCVNDTVMGGVSVSTAYHSNNNQLEWSGVLSLKNKGGFASVRHELLSPIDLRGYRGLSLIVVGDQKTYKLNLANQLGSGSPRFQARFQTHSFEQQILLPFSKLEASIRGKKVNENFDPSHLSMVGFLISDQQEGPFHLTVKSIKPYV